VPENQTDHYPDSSVKFAAGKEGTIGNEAAYNPAVQFELKVSEVEFRRMYLPIWQLGALTGHGPRVGEPGLGLIADYPWSPPYEDVKLKLK
jgi:hypothetical protein